MLFQIFQKQKQDLYVLMQVWFETKIDWEDVPSRISFILFNALLVVLP